jgi:hypothetical protein
VAPQEQSLLSRDNLDENGGGNQSVKLHALNLTPTSQTVITRTVTRETIDVTVSRVGVLSYLCPDRFERLKEQTLTLLDFVLRKGSRFFGINCAILEWLG